MRRAGLRCFVSPRSGVGLERERTRLLEEIRSQRRILSDEASSAGGVFAIATKTSSESCRPIPTNAYEFLSSLSSRARTPASDTSCVTALDSCIFGRRVARPESARSPLAVPVRRRPRAEPPWGQLSRASHGKSFPESSFRPPSADAPKADARRTASLPRRRGGSGLLRRPCGSRRPRFPPQIETPRRRKGLSGKSDDCRALSVQTAISAS